MISFVIPAHNEQELIGRAITAIREAADAVHEPYEIVVVNDSSTDATRTIALEHRAQVIDVDRRQIAAARNAGARATNGEILIFVDADTCATEPALSGALRALQNGAIGGGCSVRFERPMPLYAWVLERLLIPSLYLLRLAPGCFLFCTRQGYLDAGGFDEELFCAEEVAFAKRLKALGPFVILREHVITSPRKLRTRTAFDLIRIGIRIGLGGPKAIRQREGLDYWYGPRV